MPGSRSTSRTQHSRSSERSRWSEQSRWSKRNPTSRNLTSGNLSSGGVRGLAIAAVSLIGLVAVALLAHGAVAGDAVAVVEPADDEFAASQGETVAVDVVLRSDGGYSGEGIEAYEFVVAVHPDVAEIESLEVGPYLEGAGVDVNATVTHLEDGAARIEAERVPVDGGTTGTDVAATATLRVHDDAPEAAATIGISETRTDLAGSDYPIRSFGRDAVLRVADGEEEYEPRYGEPDEETEDDAVGVTTAEEAGRDVEGGADASDDDADPVPGFGVATALAALLVALGSWRRFWSSDR